VAPDSGNRQREAVGKRVGSDDAEVMSPIGESWKGGAHQRGSTHGITARRWGMMVRGLGPLLCRPADRSEMSRASAVCSMWWKWGDSVAGGGHRWEPSAKEERARRCTV
jgi:hypothetical protein